jgi:hypothetical protein
MQGGGGGGLRVSANEYSWLCTNGVQINFGDLSPYLVYDITGKLYNSTDNLHWFYLLKKRSLT